MLKMTCTQILKDDKGLTVGYTLKNIANQKENYSTNKLYESIKVGEIEVDNLIYDKAIGEFKFNTNKNKEDTKLKSFLNKATIMGLETKEIQVTNKEKVYYIKQSDDLHTIYIPNDVTKVYGADIAPKNEFVRLINKLHGTLKVIGGVGLTDASAMFSSCEANLTLDLTKLKLDNVKGMSLMFYHCKLNKVIFGELNAMELETIYRMFMCATIKEIYMGKVRATRILDFRQSFMNCDSLKIDISGLDGSRALGMLGKESFHYIFFNHNEEIHSGGINELIVKCPYLLDMYENRGEAKYGHS